MISASKPPGWLLDLIAPASGTKKGDSMSCVLFSESAGSCTLVSMAKEENGNWLIAPASGKKGDSMSFVFSESACSTILVSWNWICGQKCLLPSIVS